jgi:hypothetical protein
MSTVKDYTFYNLDRIEDDSTCESQRSMQNSRFATYTTSNFFNEFSSDMQVKFATSQPGIVQNGVNGGSGVGSAQVDADSFLHLKTEQERNLGRLQLMQRTFASVPYLGKGSCDPLLESQLLTGEAVADKKSVATIMSQSFMGYSLYPTSDKMNERVTDPKYKVEEVALDGWVRGGDATRIRGDIIYESQTSRPQNGLL